MHTEVKRQILGGRESHTRSSYTLDSGVVRKVYEHNRSVNRACFLKGLDKVVGFLKGDTHSGKYNGEIFVLASYGSLTRNLSGKLSVGKTRSREDRKLLTSYECIKSVNS